ncbi:helix-turn-helix domain-containing protein [Escherichia coli]|uniref:Helix-turn-helix domain-containing protein n=3 Tax=Escherichia coli TaxID=562 RepID=A0A6D0FZS5_ECOLX|nr:helix-turn-helix domain-containing protein [Escherichia coli]KAE9728687.1 helix-turn-helix domain-containing protein [Escherichia coli]KAE9729760.1 helix-turn-helix domain-containing protein [Escherichia coli]MVV61112.1 helix-turn-helix domain-containing protein [Escherichia coli]MVV70706.1 helix-turn-helix domain-containing protein [Escherichia coli]MWN41759.1 helix-turn-helix domain-containing protein [Escherichia coli]
MLKTMTINAILKYIDDNIETKNIDINELVDYSGYSRRYLQLLFSKHTGISIGKYIQRRRITRAAILLKLTKLSIVTISERLSYDSQQTFTREFKKNTGYTPLQYRNSNEWTFRHQIGHRELNDNLSGLEFRYLPEIDFYGTPILFEETIPYTGAHSQKKWNIVKNRLSFKKERLFLSNKTLQGQKNSEKFKIKSIPWEQKTFLNEKNTISEGIYIYVTYKGQINDYISHINNVHLNFLPANGLRKKNGYDLEIISQNNDESFNFEYYLPIHKEDHAECKPEQSKAYITDIHNHMLNLQHQKIN